MDRRVVWMTSVAALGVLAAASLVWAGRYAIIDSADLMRRPEEVALLERREDPYKDRDLTYPPSALPLFAALVAPGALGATRMAWLGLNLLALGALIGSVVALYGRDWPTGLQVAFGLAVAASRPVRMGIGLGQFHLIPVAFMLLAVLAVRARRPIAAGVLVGLALAKPTMALPFLGYLAARRQWLALGVAAGVQAALFGGVALWLQIAPARLAVEWLANARSQEAFGMIDVPALVARAVPYAPLGATPLTLGVLIIGLAATWGLRRQSDLGLVSFTLFVSAVFTYHRPYDLVLLVPALAYAIDVAWRSDRRWSRAKTAIAIGFALMYILPNDRRLMGGFVALYDAVFTPLCYGFLAVIVAYLCFEETSEVKAEQA